MPAPLILYSATTVLAYEIAERFYDGTHFVWCAPQPTTDRFRSSNPPSSDPLMLCEEYVRDIRGGDAHSRIIAQNRRGVIRGAQAKFDAGVINDPTKQLIEAIAGDAEIADFRPLLLVIPFAGVESIIRLPDVAERANALSQEYIIEALPRAFFDVLRYPS